ncbi:MAG TPA: SCO6880 family protein [Acidimicrobiales bacterium]
MTAEPGARRYVLEPLDTSGVFLGLAPIPCGLLGAAFTVAALGITGGLPVVAALAPLPAAAAFAFGRIGGHPLWEWLPLAVRWLCGLVLHRRRWVAPLPLFPTGGAGRVRTPPLPPCLAGLEVWDVPWRGPLRMGAVHDRQLYTLTALLMVSGPPFVLETTDEQERLLAGWGDVLAQFAGTDGTVTQVFWSDLSCPMGRPDRPGRAGHVDEDLPPAESYRRLLDEAGSSASSHETAVGLTVRLRDGRRRTAGADPGDLLGQTLVAAVEGLVRGLHSAGCAVDGPLDMMGLHRLLRRRVDPLDSAEVVAPGDLAGRLRLVTPESSGPLALDTGWRRLRVDGAWHRVWWVASWPRSPVPPAWLEPFLSATGVARTMTVASMPVPGHRSRRRIERDLVKLESDAAAKQEKGRRIDARHERATQALLDREAELVAGYAEMAYVGLVSVTARTESELEDHAEIVEQAARQAGMDLRLLDGRQDAAWAASLPLGLAPRSLTGT